MRQATAWIAAIGLLGAATTAAAQDDRIYGGVFGQYVVPDAARDSDDGAGGGALIGIPLNPWFALEVNAQGYIQQQGQNPDLYDRGGGLGLDLLWGGNSAYHKRPYLLIGGGVLFEEIKLENYTSGYANIGAGVRIRLFANGFAVRAEARGLAIFNDRAIAGEDTFLDAHARLGFEYPFGGRDSGEAPGATATVTAPGAPAPISTADSDADGVPDPSDACAATPAGIAVDFRGCPADSDSDGVSDDRDACPNTLKQFNVDARGCAVLQSVVLEKVNFEHNSTSLEFNAKTLLAELGSCLVGQPAMQLEIGGHTDNVGSQEYNLKLSQERARAVREFLIGYGVAADRLRAEGYGEFQPVADNATEAGRAENRRVEVKVIP